MNNWEDFNNVVRKLESKAQVFYGSFTIPRNVCYDMYYKNFNESAKEYFQV